MRVYEYFSPHLSRGSTGWVGVGGGLIAFCRLLPVASSFRHAPDVTLCRSSLAILDTLMMLRSIDFLLQSSTPSTTSLLQRARVFENMVVERGVPPEADAVTYFEPETLRDFLAAENQCVEQFCADLLQEEADVQV